MFWVLKHLMFIFPLDERPLFPSAIRKVIHLKRTPPSDACIYLDKSKAMLKIAQAV